MKNTLVNMLLSLGVLVLLSGAMLAGVKLLTQEPIARAVLDARNDAFRSVLNEFNNNPAEDVVEMSDGVEVYFAKMDGTPVGEAVQITSPDGFGGPFTLMVGFDNNGDIVGYKVLSHSETPGLGAKMDSWFMDASRPSRNVLGRNPVAAELTVSKDGGQIDAISGATISSRAFLKAINRAACAAHEAKEVTR